jgi:hypothetical protein
MTSGRPILVIPYIGRFERLGTNILVGWNNSREAARAMNDAIPILAKAASVTILEANPVGRKPAIDDAASADITRHLTRHAVSGNRSSRACWPCSPKAPQYMLGSCARSPSYLPRASAMERKDAADQRLVTRELMVQFPLIARAAVNAVTLRADGLDSDIAALCDIPPVQ